MITSYWCFIGTIYLLILTYMDYKQLGRVDDRFNFFMMGVTLSLASHFKRSMLTILLLLAVMIALYYFFQKSKVFGEADIKTFMWLFWGYGIINLGYFVFFGAVLIVYTAFFGFARFLYMRIRKIHGKVITPFYGVILLAFISFNLLLGLY